LAGGDLIDASRYLLLTGGDPVDALPHGVDIERHCAKLLLIEGRRDQRMARKFEPCPAVVHRKWKGDSNRFELYQEMRNHFIEIIG
jgi:hypothetical protein